MTKKNDASVALGNCTMDKRNHDKENIRALQSTTKASEIAAPSATHRSEMRRVISAILYHALLLQVANSLDCDPGQAKKHPEPITPFQPRPSSDVLNASGGEENGVHSPVPIAQARQRKGTRDRRLRPGYTRTTKGN